MSSSYEYISRTIAADSSIAHQESTSPARAALTEAEQEHILSEVITTLQHKVSDINQQLREYYPDQERESSVRNEAFTQLIADLWGLVEQKSGLKPLSGSNPSYIDLGNCPHASDQEFIRKVEELIQEILITAQYSSQLEGILFRFNLFIGAVELDPAEESEQRLDMFYKLKSDFDGVIDQLKGRLSTDLINQLKIDMAEKIKIGLRVDPIVQHPASAASSSVPTRELPAPREELFDEEHYKNAFILQLESELTLCSKTTFTAPMHVLDKLAELKRKINTGLDRFEYSLSTGLARGKLTDDDKIRIRKELEARACSLPVVTEVSDENRALQRKTNSLMLALARGELRFSSSRVREDFIDSLTRDSELTRESWKQGPR